MRNLLLVSSLLSAVLLTQVEYLGIAPRLAWFAAGALGIVLIFALKRVLAVDWLDPIIAYLTVFWMFHLAFVFVASIMPDVVDSQPIWNSYWLTTRSTLIAIFAALLFMQVFVLGFLWSYRKPRDTSADIGFAPELVVVGWGVLAFGLLLFTLSAATYGLATFFRSYIEFFRVSNSFANAIVIVALGLAFQLAGGRPIRAVLLTASVTYVPIATVTFIAGARTAPLFTLLVLGILLHRQGLRIPRWALTASVVVLLTAIGTVREVRLIGLGDVRLAGAPVGVESPLSGMTELGGSIVPVIATVDYLRTSDYFYGETYVFPFQRQIMKLAGGIEDSSTDDPRFVADHISSMYGAIGYSTVAEAYINAGIIGVMVFSLLWGLLFGYLNSNSYTPYGLMVFTAVLIPMMINIRNSFIFVPAWIVVALVPLGIARVFGQKRFRFMSRRHRPLNQRG